MEQDVFYKVSPFDRKSVDLSKPATSVDDYMRQVIVSRESIPTVAVAANYKEIVSNGGPKKPSLIGCDDTLPRTSRFLPGKGWNILKVLFY